MNKQEVEQKLTNLGVQPRNYTLNGPPYKDSSWVMESFFSIKRLAKTWRVFKFERGDKYDISLFDTEDEACQFIYERLEKFQEIMGKFIL